MTTKYTPEDYQYYINGNGNFHNYKANQRNNLADQLKQFDINKLTPKQKLDFKNQLETYILSYRPRAPGQTTSALRDAFIEIDKQMTSATQNYNAARLAKIKELEASKLPEPDISEDLVLGDPTEPVLSLPTIGGKQRKFACGCNKHGGQQRGKSRSKSRQRGKSRSKSRSKSKK